MYYSHRSFFENPLLLSIMLITFRDSASIPSELHNFYSLAFEALYYRHDASKTFKRPTLTNLPVNKGKDIMAAFSLITYINNQTIFSSYELRDLLLKSMKLADCECDVNELTSDLLRAYCMLLQEGTKYQYTHRSFQEYFAACYLVAANDSNQSKLIKQFCQRADTDITLQLAYGMNPKMIEEKLIIPFLKQFRENIGYTSEINKDVFLLFAKHYFKSVSRLNNQYLTLSIAGTENNPSTDFDKLLNLNITRFILIIYNIDREFKDEENRFKGDDILFRTNNGNREIEISKAFEVPEVLEWFLNHSLESRIVKDLMKLERLLLDKNKRSSDLFDSLLEDKTAHNKSSIGNDAVN